MNEVRDLNILEMSGSAAILIIAVVVLRALFIHKLPKRTFMALWGVAVVRLLIPLQFSSPLSIYSLFSLFWGTDTGVKGGINTIMPNTAVGAVSTIPADIPSQVTNQISPLIIVWFVGFIVCFLFFGITYIKCRREFACSLTVQNDFVSHWLNINKTARHLQIRQSDKIKAPLTYGILRPVILLPKETDWGNKQQLEYVLSHEMVHIKRFDALYKLLLTLCVCIHWFNPLVWVMIILAGRDIELACDERVVRLSGIDVRSNYAHTLLNLEVKKSRLTPLCNNFSKNSIEERIISIMKLKKTTMTGLIAAALIVVSTTTVFATTALTNKPAEEPITGDAYLYTYQDDATGETKLSADGKTWMNEDEYNLLYPTPEVEWWTYDEYKAWMEQTLSDMQTLVGDTTSGYYDNEGNLRHLTKEDVDKAQENFNAVLNDIKNGIKVSKSVDGQDKMMISYNPDEIKVGTGYLMSIVGDNAEPIVFGPYETREQLIEAVKPYCEEQVQAGNMTRDEADKIIADAAN